MHGLRVRKQSAVFWCRKWIYNWLFQTHLHFANIYEILSKAYGLTSARLSFTILVVLALFQGVQMRADAAHLDALKQGYSL